MQGGVPRNAHYHDVSVALFNAADGTRILNATVQVTVSSPDLGLPEQARPLKRASIHGAVSYGGDFNMPQAGDYVIHLQVSGPGKPERETDFRYRHFGPSPDRSGPVRRQEHPDPPRLPPPAAPARRRSRGAAGPAAHAVRGPAPGPRDRPAGGAAGILADPRGREAAGADVTEHALGRFAVRVHQEG
ncbi:MAG TPA: hypothetical protein VFA95_15895 [Gammaproteobacteria bacterium]|nr:hypothetical protein [Gammaproteobacteria bacterium]